MVCRREAAGRHRGPAATALKRNYPRKIPGQIKKIIITHVHDDHANDLIKFALNARARIELIGTAEVLYSLKAKIVASMGETEGRVEKLFHWRIVEGRKSFNLYGYDFTFHYGMHSVPSVGLNVGKDEELLLTISGDTVTQTKAEEALKAGAISSARYAELMAILNSDARVVLVDVGEAVIHGFARDLQQLDRRRVIGYHCSKLSADAPQNLKLAKPGEIYLAERIDDALANAGHVTQVINSMTGMSADWLMSVISQSETACCEAGQVIIQKDSNEKDSFYVLAHGIVDVMIDGQRVATLGQGDYFGEQALLTGSPRNASVVARTRSRIVVVPRALFKNMMDTAEDLYARQTVKKGVSPTARLAGMWQKRSLISRISVLKGIPARKLNELALMVEERAVALGREIIIKGPSDDMVYLLVRGTAEVQLDRHDVKNPMLDAPALIGEIAAMQMTKSRTATVVAQSACTVFVMKGDDFRRLVDELPLIEWNVTKLVESRIANNKAA